MIDDVYDYAIVGTGLSSLGILNKISKKNKKIIIIESSNPVIKKNFKKPIFCEERIPIPIDKNFLNKERPFLKLLNYKSLGGNTNFWGGYCSRFDKDDIGNWPINIGDLSKHYLEAKKILNLKNTKQKFDSNLSISNSIIAKENGKIFNSTNKIQTIIKKKNVKIVFDELVMFEKKNGIYNLILKKKKKFLCKKIIICAGVFGTQKILKKSIKKLTFKKVEQAQSFIIPAISLKDYKDSKIDKQVIYNSKKFGNIYFEFKKDDELLKKTLNPINFFFQKFIPKILIKKTFIIWGFIPSKFSYDYKIIKNKILINNFNKKKKVKTLKYIEMVSYILKEKLNFIVFNKIIKLNQFARSYHIGSNIPMSLKKKKYITTKINGELNLKNYDNIFIAGSSVFPNLPSKSHGLTILANSLRIGEYLNNEQ